MKSFRIHCYIAGIILIILGVLAMRYPVSAILSVGVFMGIGLVCSGINYFSGFYFFGLKRFILLGILDIITGIIMISQPGVTAFVIPFIVGAWLFITGLSRIGTALWLGGAKIRGWWLMLLNGIALVILAGVVSASPLMASLSVMMILAGVLIASGVLAIIEGLALRP